MASKDTELVKGLSDLPCLMTAQQVDNKLHAMIQIEHYGLQRNKPLQIQMYTNIKGHGGQTSM